jgi:tRNA1Val (adenine37-N6)-methyltransferase
MSVFRFKQFSINQSGCTMKINTDGVLLGAMVNGENIKRILDIGTGTGVIAMMLGQRFADANIHAVEIDEQAAQTAALNFEESVFHKRLTVYPLSFEQFFDDYPDQRYDLIVSNPPFYINSLLSPAENKALAKHADTGFFERLIELTSRQLNPGGLLWLILPVDTAELVKESVQFHNLYLQKNVCIRSYVESKPHRELLAFGFTKTEPKQKQFVIYKEPKQYSDEYQDLLRDFFTIF